MVALGALLGGGPALATAADSTPENVPPAGLQALLPAVTLTVTTAADVVDPGDGELSLREAVAAANATGSVDTIGFAADLEGMTLTLTRGELLLTQDLVIDGDRNDDGRRVTLDGNGSGRIFHATGLATDIELRELTLAHGRSGAGANGGAILASGARLAVTGCTIEHSYAGTYAAPGDGGGIFAAGGSRLTVVGSRLSDNGASRSGGGIATGSRVALVVRGSQLAHNFTSRFFGGAIFLSGGSSLAMEGSAAIGNGGGEYSVGGALAVEGSTAVISRSTIAGNHANDAGAMIVDDGSAWVTDSTIANNLADGEFARAGGILGGRLVIRNSTVTGNRVTNTPPETMGRAGGVWGTVDIANTIVAGNSSTYRGNPDLGGTITLSNGHNVFGSTVAGSIAGDRQNVAAATVFATIDAGTGGGKLSSTGIVPLKNALTNPALSAADPITASSFGQLGTTPRPQPAGSLPDISAIEIKQKLSTSPTVNNDVLTGSGGANNLSGLAGNDLILGLAGADTLNGNDGSDVLDGGPGNDVLNGGNGVDIATFAGAVAVVVDLSAKPATARRGSETDTLTSIEGIIGSSKADIFKGDAANNEFQGGLGKDTATGGAGRDLYAFRSVQDSPAGTGRDLVKDFAPGQDVIDVGNIDADSTTPGQQSFRWVGKATLTGTAQLGYFVSGGNTIVRASTDADVQPELEIQLTGSKTLTAADFRF